MNILVLNWQDIRHPLAGGAETHLHEIFRRVAAAGHAVTLYSSHFEGAKEREILDGITVLREGTRNVFNAYVPKRYLRQFRHENYDVVIDDINKIPFFTPLYVRKPLLAIAHHFFGKSIFTEAGMLAGSYVYAAEQAMFRVYKQTPFAVVSESTREELLGHGFPAGNLSILPNCIAHEQFPFAVQEKPAHPVITYFGRLKRYKSPHHLLEAYSLLKHEFPTAEVRIIGKGDAEQEIRALAARLGIAENVRFYGFIAEEEKAGLLGSSHCVVNPSMKEGWGIINIEANACGTPVIAANVPGLRDAVQHEVSGLLYDYGDIPTLAELLRRVLTDTALQTRLAHGAIGFARQFNWDDSALKIIKRVEELVMLPPTRLFREEDR
ncbi:MAG: glycosyltransferase family 1 protein [Candidatus Kapaibacterium sp.]|nr:MAG: glycosyltransferase family 1 protein [Candidatus Kapabacteria bacterium]